MLIYKATNKLNQKSYIGKTERTIDIRLSEHIKESKKENITSYFHRALRKYGIDNFELTILAETDNSTDLDNLEIEFIATFNTIKPNGYNITEGGTGGNTYRNLDSDHLKEIIQKSSETRKKNYILNPDRKIRRSEISNDFWNTIYQDDKALEEYGIRISNGLRAAWQEKVLTEEDRLRYSIGQKNRFEKETAEEAQERIRKFKEASGTAKSWRLTFPDGSTEIIKSINDFCKENNLPYNIIYGCHRKKKPSKHGWNLEEIHDK
jgi:group I intron endonuclease